MSNHEKTPEKKKKKLTLKENIISLGSALIIVLAIRSTIVEPFIIPSGSMIPTLLIGDRIFVNKLAYGIKLPFSDWLADAPITLIPTGKPTRGDIIVFKAKPGQEINQSTTYFIKRVIGTPGDTLEMKNKLVYINNEPVSRKELADQERAEVLELFADMPRYTPANMRVFKETHPNTESTTMVDTSSYRSESFEPFTIPEGQYFVMGDNRDDSSDSRFWGTVPQENIRGKAMVIWLSFWLDFDTKEYFFRPFRIGKILH